MTEEIKEKECDCKKCETCKKIIAGTKEFIFKVLIVYVGATLAIITSANLLKPKHFCPMKRMPGMERPLPPPMMYGDFNRMHHFRGDRPDFAGKRGEFKKFPGGKHWNRPQGPVNNDMPQPKK